MASSPELKKKEDKEGLATLINRWFDEATKTRQGFTPEVVREFEAAGARAAMSRGVSRREAPQRQHEEGMREVTPSRQLNVVVRRAGEEKERESLSPVMTKRAIESAVRFGEILELASGDPGKLNIGKWVRG
jgi:hypothetical protein